MFEEEGLATTQISLIRLHTERMQPPRALWVPFELGRPLGAPDDSEFQKRVLTSALGLLDAKEGPVLVDFPEDVPNASSDAAEEATTGLACAIDLPPLPDPEAPKSALGQALLNEVRSLAPWHQLAVRERGRTTVGLSGLDVEVAAKFLAAFLDNQEAPAPRDDMPPGHVLKLAYEDLKAYYGEAITAQPGYATSRSVEDWLFRETVLGQALWALRDLCLASDDERFHYLGRNSIVPDRQIDTST